MPGAGYLLRDREVRIYDGTIDPKPNYVKIALLDDGFAFDVVPPSAEEELILDGGNVTDDSFYAVTSEAATFNAIDVPIRFRIQSTKKELVQALGNYENRNPWTVNGVTWNPILPANMGTRINSRGQAITPPTSAITRNVDTMVSIYARWNPPPVDAGGDPLIVGLIGVAIGQGRFEPEGATLTYTTTMRHYGGYVFGLGAFPDGNESIPS